MNQIKTLLVVSILCFSMVVIPSYYDNLNSEGAELLTGTYQITTSNQMNSLLFDPSDYTQVNEAFIANGDAEFDNIVGNYTLSGNGSEYNPYVIGGFFFNTTGMAIHLSYINYYVIIYNNAFASNCTCNTIRIDGESDWVSIINNTITGNTSNSIFLDDAFDSVVANNTIHSQASNYSIDVLYGNGGVIANNSITNTGTGGGVRILNTNTFQLENNNIISESTSILVEESSDIQITHNTISSGSTAIHGNNNNGQINILNNILTSRGNFAIYIYSAYLLFISGNVITGSHAGMYFAFIYSLLTLTQNDISVATYAILVYFIYAFLVEFNRILMASTGIQIYYTSTPSTPFSVSSVSSDYVIANNTFMNIQHEGINLLPTEPVIIADNTISLSNLEGYGHTDDQGRSAIKFSSSSGNHVFRNKITGGGLMFASTTDMEQNLSNDNTINGQKLGYFTNTSIISITSQNESYGQVIILDATSITITDQIYQNINNPIIIRGVTSEINIRNNQFHNVYSYAIDIEIENGHFIIENNEFKNSLGAILAGSPIFLFDLLITTTQESVQDQENVSTIQNNYFENMGLLNVIEVFTLGNLEINNNTLLHAQSSFLMATNIDQIKIENNQIFRAAQLPDTMIIYLGNSENIYFANNQIHYSNDVGITLEFIDNLVIVNNVIVDTVYEALWVNFVNSINVTANIFQSHSLEPAIMINNVGSVQFNENVVIAKNAVTIIDITSSNLVILSSIDYTSTLMNNDFYGYSHGGSIVYVDLFDGFIDGNYYSNYNGNGYYVTPEDIDYNPAELPNRPIPPVTITSSNQMHSSNITQATAQWTINSEFTHYGYVLVQNQFVEYVLVNSNHQHVITFSGNGVYKATLVIYDLNGELVIQTITFTVGLDTAQVTNTVTQEVTITEQTTIHVDTTEENETATEGGLSAPFGTLFFIVTFTVLIVTSYRRETNQ
jgi:nitrous oxidase accessory protein NosD